MGDGNFFPDREKIVFPQRDTFESALYLEPLGSSGWTRSPGSAESYSSDHISHDAQCPDRDSPVPGSLLERRSLNPQGSEDVSQACMGVLLLFETGSPYVPQAGLEIMEILLPQRLSTEITDVCHHA